MLIKTENAEAIAKRMMFLAYEACGGPMGMGIFQAVANATEEMVWNNVRVKGDYPGKRNPDDTDLSADYVFGRMMKLYLKVTAEGIEVPGGTPRIDYQAWCHKYPTYQSLFEAANANL